MNVMGYLKLLMDDVVSFFFCQLSTQELTSQVNQLSSVFGLFLDPYAGPRVTL